MLFRENQHWQCNAELAPWPLCRSHEYSSWSPFGLSLLFLSNNHPKAVSYTTAVSDFPDYWPGLTLLVSRVLTQMTPFSRRVLRSAVGAGWAGHLAAPPTQPFILKRAWLPTRPSQSCMQETKESWSFWATADPGFRMHMTSLLSHPTGQSKS